MTKILLVQGANLTFLGRREPAIYGTTTTAELDAMLQSHARKHDYVLDIFYSNIEGEAINRHLCRLCAEGLRQGGRPAVRRSPYQQYCQTQHPLRLIGRGRGLLSPALRCTPTFSVSTPYSRFCEHGRRIAVLRSAD
jgi:hypothetical protein